MKIIVGLGNPGRKYKGTRHNIGFRVIEELAGRYTIEKEESRYDAIIGHLRVAGEKVLLVKPLTYMNLSGGAVQPLVHFYKIDLSNLIVAHDDMDLPAGVLRLRPGGGSGGHKGISSIIDRLGSRDFARVRVGIGRPGDETIDWVLGSFTRDQQTAMDQVVDRAADALECWIKAGIDKAMNEYN